MGGFELALMPHRAPNFFIIGAPKSGTTALSQYLRDHPNIFFSGVKEPHFFDLDTSKRLKLDLQTYLSLFAKARPELHIAVGEGSTGYLFSKVAVSEILKFNPDSKFIVMLRNPVDLVQAWHSEMYFEGVENIRDFEGRGKWSRSGARQEHTRPLLGAEEAVLLGVGEARGPDGAPVVRRGSGPAEGDSLRRLRGRYKGGLRGRSCRSSVFRWTERTISGR